MSPDVKLDLYCRAYLAALGNSEFRVHGEADRYARSFVRDAKVFEAEIAETREPPHNPRPPAVLP